MKYLNIMDEVPRDSIMTQGITTGLLSGYLYQAYLVVLPWFLPCLPLIILVCKYGRQNALLKGEEVTWMRTIKMATNKFFNYVCWIMIATTLSIAFESDLPLIVIMALVYGLEVLKLMLRYCQAHGYEVTERKAFALFLQIVLSKITGTEVVVPEDFTAEPTKTKTKTKKQ